MGYVSGERVRGTARTEIGTGNGSRRQDAARGGQAPAGPGHAAAGRQPPPNRPNGAAPAPGRRPLPPASRRQAGANGAEEAGRRRRQAPAGGSRPRPGRRQRRCALDRRPDLRAAAEAVQPAVHGGRGGLRRMARRSASCSPGPCCRRDPAASSFLAVFASPMMIVVLATIVLPIALFWFLAHARLARAGTEADVLGHDRGGGAAGGARPRRPSSRRPRWARRCAGRSRS